MHKRPGKFIVDWHSHDLSQLILAEQGTLHINVDGTCLVLPPWYCVWIPPRLSHEIWSSSPDVTLRSLFFESNACKQNFYHTPSVFPISPLLREMIRYTERWNNVTMEDTSEQIFMKAIQHTLPDAMKASVNIKLPSSKNERLVDIIDYLQQHISEKVSVDSLGIQFGISPRSLHRLFVQELGIPFSTYMKMMRIMYAVDLLSQGSNSIAEVAASVGYDSLPTFSNNFVELVGNRPSYFIPGNKEKLQYDLRVA